MVNEIMKEIKTSKSLENFFEKITRAIKKTYLNGIVSFVKDKNDFYVQFDRFGVSKFFFEVNDFETGFIATRKKDSIAFTHHIFKDKVAQTLKDLISKFDETEIK